MSASKKRNVTEAELDSAALPFFQEMQALPQPQQNLWWQVIEQDINSVFEEGWDNDVRLPSIKERPVWKNVNNLSEYFGSVLNLNVQGPRGNILKELGIPFVSEEDALPQPSSTPQVIQRSAKRKALGTLARK